MPVISRYLPGFLLDPAQEYEAAGKAGAIIQGFLLTGEFPIFPWAAFPLLGFVLGRRIAVGETRKDLPYLIIIGAGLIVTVLCGAYIAVGRPQASIITDYIAPLSFYPDSFTMICYQCGVALIFFCRLFYRYDIPRPGSRETGFLVRIYSLASRSSLTFYFLHYPLIGWPLALIYVATGKYPKYALPGAVPALVCGLGAVAVLLSLLALWERHDRKYSLEWFLSAATRRFAS